MRIGLLGLAGAGKDTVAGYIKSLVNYPVRIDRYAAPLKNAAYEVFGSNCDERTLKDSTWYVSDVLREEMEVAAKHCIRTVGNSAEERTEMLREYYKVFQDVLTITPRQYQQKLGTEVIRQINPHAFVERIRNKTAAHLNHVVTDVRFENELLDVNIIIYRPDLERMSHESERLACELYNEIQEHNLGAHLTPVKILGNTYLVINNMGTLDDLRSDTLATLQINKLL